MFYNPNVTTIDYPDGIGIIAFTKGCNLRCPICHNPALVLPDYADDFPEWDKYQLAKYAADSWADGVCISGGEPTLHHGLLMGIAYALKDRGIKMKLDTNGSNPYILKQMFEKDLLDYVAIDVKAPLVPDKIAAVCGIPLNKTARYISLLEESIATVKSSEINYEFRTVCCEHFLSPDDIGELAREIAPADKYVLARFKPDVTLDPALSKLEPASEQYMEACLLEARKYLPDTSER